MNHADFIFDQVCAKMNDRSTNPFHVMVWNNKTTAQNYGVTHDELIFFKGQKPARNISPLTWKWRGTYRTLFYRKFI